MTTKLQLLETVDALQNAHEHITKEQDHARLANGAVEYLATGNHKPLHGAVTDAFGPAAPLAVALSGLVDGAKGEDNTAKVVKTQAVGATVVVGSAVVSAAASGAGALAGYAGIASAVATLGGGAATTAIASAVGLTAASGAPLVGAAATAAVTAAVGGPVVVAVAAVGAVSAVGFGVYKATRWLGGKLFG